MKVSVVLPVFNDEKHISEALESVCNQDLKDFEVICVDDGSTDSTPDILFQYSLKYINLRLVTLSKNHGLSFARNAGIKVAQGDYLFFMDSDDVLEDSALAYAWNICNTKNLDILFFSFKNFCDSDVLKQKYQRKLSERKRMWDSPNVMSGLELMKNMYRYSEYYVVVWAQMVNRSFLMVNSIDFYEGIIYEDNLYTFEVLIHAKRTFCISKECYCKRIRENSIVTKQQDYNSVRGFYITLRQELRYLDSTFIDKQYYDVLIAEGLRVRNQMIHYFEKIDEHEKCTFLNSLSLEERLFFELLK